MASAWALDESHDTISTFNICVQILKGIEEGTVLELCIIQVEKSPECQNYSIVLDYKFVIIVDKDCNYVITVAFLPLKQ